MNKYLLNTGVQNFINENWNADIVSVLLKKPIFEGVSQKELAEQLEAKKKCKDKLPLWFSTTNIVYPNKLHIEQSSSEKTALYKSDLVSGKMLLDISGGLGVDSFFFAQKMEVVHHCEINGKLSTIARHNLKVLGQKNVKTIPKNGLIYLKESDLNFDWIYIDPSRRDNSKKKVILLKDCLPNVPENLSFLFEKSKNLLIKTSPILDISHALNELENVKEVHVVALENEVKEVLYVLEKGWDSEPLFKAVNLVKEEKIVFPFTRLEEKNSDLCLSSPKEYLYEPNAAILKAGAFKIVGDQFQVQKLGHNSHLYTSSELTDFPGRKFQIESVETFSQKNMKRFIGEKANVSVRNFPLTVAEIRKKFKIKDGGSLYLFFTKNPNDKNIVIECVKIKENS